MQWFGVLENMLGLLPEIAALFLAFFERIAETLDKSLHWKVATQRENREKLQET